MSIPSHHTSHKITAPEDQSMRVLPNDHPEERDESDDKSLTVSKSPEPEMGASSSPQSNVVPAADTPAAAITVEDVGVLIQGLCSTDNVTVNAALDALEEDKVKCENVVTAGGSHALVLLARNFLAKAIVQFPDSESVTELDGEELTTLYKALRAITGLTYQNKMSRVGISAIGGVEVVLNVMVAFPNCQPLQWIACVPVRNLAHCDIGKKKALDNNGMQIVLTSIQNHVGSAVVCESALYALVNMIKESKKNTERLIGLGGAAVLVRVKNQWPDNVVVQPPLRRLSKMIAEEIHSWVDCE
jgi:hypothetical protein